MTAITESHVLHVAGSDGRSLSYLSQINEVDLQVVSDAIGKISSSPYVSEGQEKQPLVCIREILSNGENALLETTLRRLLGLVNSAAADIDANGHDNLDNKSFAEYQPKDLIVRRIVPIAAPMIEGMIMAPQIVCKSVAINLLQRDLRILDFDSHPSEKPSIRVRRHAVLFSVDPIRAIIMSTRILIIVPPGGMDQILEIVEKYMAGWTLDHNQHHSDLENDYGNGNGNRDRTGNGSISFESHAFEAILATTSTLNSQEYKLINDQAQKALSYFQSKLGLLLPYGIQEEMRAVKNSIFNLQTKNSSLRKTLTVLIYDDEAMALMSLTKLRKNPDLYRFPMSDDLLSAHEEIEELLESYLVDCNSLHEALTYLLVTLQNAEDLLVLKLDTSRNRLLVTNTTLVVYLVAIAFSAYLTGIYGMNLDQTVTIQTVVYGVFEVMFVSSFSLIFIISGCILYYLKRNRIIPKEVFYRRKKDN